MSLGYNVWTEEDVKNRNVVDEGDYPFEIENIAKVKTQPGVDKNGNPKPIRDMLEIEFIFWDINGIVKKQKDWIVFMEGMDWKLRHLANTTGKLDLYEANELDIPHLQKAKGVFSLGIKEFKGKDGLMKKGNFVKDYVKKEVQGDDSFKDDDIKF